MPTCPTCARWSFRASSSRLELGKATRVDEGWWCPYTAARAIVLGDVGEERFNGLSVLDVTTVFAALAVEGPLARELFARFTALDLRDAVCPVGSFLPGSVARTPGAILRAGEESWLMLFGAALGQYVWTVVADAAESLGGGPGRRGRARAPGGDVPCVTSSAPGACGESARSSRTPTTW